MSPKKKNDSLGDFYQDLDQKKYNSFCSLPLIIILLVIIFVGIVFGLIWMKNSYNSDYEFKLSTSSYEIEDQNIGDFFKQKFEGKNSGEIITTKIYEEEMAQYIGIENPNFPLKKSTLQIEERGVVIKGKTGDSILSFPVEVLVVPEIVDKKLEFSISDANAGFISLPSAIKEGLNDYIISSVNNKLNSMENIEYTDAKSFEDYIEVIGTVTK